MCCPLVFEFSVGIGGFVIGLGQISFFFSKSAKKELYVYCNVCETSLVKEAERSLLRRVFLENNKNQIFIRPYKVPLLFWDIRTLHFEITDKDNKPATFLTNEVCLSVEFREGIKGAAEEFPHF